MSKMFIEAIKNIPKLSGVYFFKDKNENIIYIGKAKNLYKRLAYYFQRQNIDWKVQELIKEHSLIDYILTKDETEALLLEAQLVQKFKPKYNILLKSGTPFIYLEIINQELPRLVLNKKKPKNNSTYFGPFLFKSRIRSVYEYLLRTFKLKLCSIKIDQGCLDYHIGRCAGSCLKDFDIDSYKTRLEIVKELLNGNFQACKDLLLEQIKKYNQNLEFEKSKHISEYFQNLEHIFQTLKTKFSENKYNNQVNIITTPVKYKHKEPLEALKELQMLLNLDKKPRTIDCFDVSHFQSRYIVGSCIRFTLGLPDKNNFRKFKVRSLEIQNDYAALQEIVKRRYKNPKDLPDIILIDGGKGQLSSVKNILPTDAKTICISLAKREETLFFHNLFNLSNLSSNIKLDPKTHIGKLIISLRDYTHHFAITYHKHLRSKNIK